MERDVLEPGDRLLLAFDLFETAEAMMRVRLRRSHPEADAQRIEQLLQEWLQHRRGAEHGDGHGQPVAWSDP